MCSDVRVRRFVASHRESYFLYDFRRSPEFREVFNDYLTAMVKLNGLSSFKSWLADDGKNVSSDKAFAYSFPCEKESKDDVRAEFAKEFAGTNTKFEDCVKYADELAPCLLAELQHRADIIWSKMK